MKVLVMGASRGIGLEAVKALLAAGHGVRAMARGDIPAPDHAMLERLHADALDPAAVAGALQGVDAVVQSLGVRITPATLLGRVDLFSRATDALLPAMAQAGLRRLIAVTGFGAGASRQAMSMLERLGHDALLGRIYADKTVQEAAIEASDLDWTIPRPGILTNGRGRGAYRVLTSPETWRNGVIARADVGHYIARAVDDPSSFRTAPVLIY